MKKATIQDVAKLADVSVGSVSKYVNGSKVSKKTRDKIKKAIDTLEYVPNTLARNLAMGKSYTIVLVIIHESPIRVSTWMHELSIIQGAIEEAKKENYSLKIEMATIENAEENLKIINSYISNKTTDGIILLTPWWVGEDILVELKFHKFPYVIIGRGEKEDENCSIEFDNSTPIYEMVKHLYEEGHRKFEMVAGFKTQVHSMLREQGFRKALIDLGNDENNIKVHYSDYSPQDGVKIGGEILKNAEHPTAIICANDYLASGVIKAALNCGLRVPEDVVVTGFDASVVSDAASPTITTVELPVFEAGRMATHELFKRIANPEYKFEKMCMSSNIIYKESTKKGVSYEESN